jgi:hypothetical protein
MGGSAEFLFCHEKIRSLCSEDMPHVYNVPYHVDPCGLRNAT